jgi:hypothetical protein
MATFFTNNEDLSSHRKKLKSLKITSEFTSKDQKVIALFYDKEQKERQDMMLINPVSLTVIPELDEEKGL